MPVVFVNFHSGIHFTFAGRKQTNKIKLPKQCPRTCGDDQKKERGCGEEEGKKTGRKERGIDPRDACVLKENAF